MSTNCETNIIYNDIPLQDVLTESIDNQIVRDSTGTDPIGIRTTITVVAMAHVSYPVVHGIRVEWKSSKSISPGLRVIIDKLMVPRKTFVMSIGGQNLYYIMPSGTEPGYCNPNPIANDYWKMDIENGPWSSIQVLAVRGKTTAKCRFTFTFVTPICGNPQNLNDVLNLRYWIADDIDCSTWLTTRRYQGVFRVRSRNGVINPHMLARQITLPPIQTGFRRASIQWSESPNPLEFGFSIVDVEQWAQAPSPATDWDGTYSITIPQGEVCAEAELTFRLRGDKFVDKRHLFKLAQRIIDCKLHYQEIIKKGPDATNCLLMNQIWHEDLKANEIGVTLRIKYVGSEWINQNLPERDTKLGPSFDLGLPLSSEVSNYEDNPRKKLYDKEISTYPPGGLPTATIYGLFVCALQTDCCPQTLSQIQIKQGAPVSFQSEFYAPQEGTRTAQLGTQKTRLTEDHIRAPYLWYKITNRYYEDTGWRGFPKGKQCESSSNDATLAFSHLHCPVSMREVTISACRVDEWPSLPKKVHWKDRVTDINFVLRHAKTNPSAVQLTADGKHEMREVSAVYWYYMSRPFKDNEAMLVGTPPFLSDPALINNASIIESSTFNEAELMLGYSS